MNTDILKWFTYFFFSIFNIMIGVYFFNNYTKKLISYTNKKENYFLYLIYIIIGFFSSFIMKIIFNKNLVIKLFKHFSKNNFKLNHNFEYLGEKIYLFILYSFCIINFIIFGKGTHYIPNIFGGKSDDSLEYLEKNMHIEIPNKGLLFMFYFMLGHHIFRTINHTIYGKSEIIMLTIHHHITIYLMIFTFCFRYYLLGIKISFCHDLTDVPRNSAKFLNEIKAKKYLNIISIILYLILWTFFRDYIFSYKIYFQSFYIQYISKEAKTQYIRSMINNIHIISFIILSVLVFMDFIWTIKIINLLKKQFLKRKLKKIKEN